MPQRYGCPSGGCRSTTEYSLVIFWTLIILLNLGLDGQLGAGAEDAPPTPQLPMFDLSALANLANSLGDPQIMSLVSNLLNPQRAPADPQTNSNQQNKELITTAQKSGVQPNQEPAQVGPLRRDSGEQMTDQPKAVVVADNPLGSLLSKLPNLFPGLNLNNLSGLLGPNKTNQSPQQPPVATVASVKAPEPPGQSTQTAETTSVIIPKLMSKQSIAPSGPANILNNPALSVVNQVVSAYIGGQIPIELILLGLSGKVPPQVVEMALSGRVPAEVIQMVITGQFPMSTINAFLNALQQQGPNRGPMGNMFYTTKSLFEALFGLNRKRVGESRSGLTVPTLLGPVRVPGMANVRSFGQFVGGTISNVSSLIPF